IVPEATPPSCANCWKRDCRLRIPSRYCCTWLSVAWSCGDSTAARSGAARAGSAQSAGAAESMASNRRRLSGDMSVLRYRRPKGSREGVASTGARGLFDIARQHLALADMVGGADHAFRLHALDDARGTVVADLEVALH